MLTIKIRNDNGELVEYKYDSVEALAKEYWSDSIDMNVPANDAEVFSFKEDGGTEIVGHFDFEEVLKLLGVIKDPKYTIVASQAQKEGNHLRYEEKTFS